MSCTILIVDDDAAVRQALCTILRHAGYETVEAQNGKEALQRMHQEEYKLITMDVAMDGLDGVDTISVIRGERDVPIIAISAFLTANICKDLRNRGVNHLLEKPFTRMQVLDVVRNALGEA